MCTFFRICIAPGMVNLWIKFNKRGLLSFLLNIAIQMSRIFKICYSEVYKDVENKFYGTISDITEEKERERENEAILRTLDAATDAIKGVKINNSHPITSLEVSF